MPTIKTLPEEMKELYLEPDQVRSLIRWLDPLRADMVEFALACGQRRNNVRTLRWSQISKCGELMTFASSETKNGDRLVVPLNDDAKAILKKRERYQEELIKRRPFLRGKIDCVFVQENGKPFSKDAVGNKTWRKAVDLLDYKGTTFHTVALVRNVASTGWRFVSRWRWRVEVDELASAVPHNMPEQAANRIVGS